MVCPRTFSVSRCSRIDVTVSALDDATSLDNGVLILSPLKAVDGVEYVVAQGYNAITVTAEECQFCHQEPLVMFTEHQQREFRQSGGFIVPLSA